MVCIAYTKQFLFKTFFPIIHIFLEIFQQFEKLDILCKYFFNWLYNIFTIIVDTHYRKKFSKRYPFRKAVSFPQNQFSEQNRKVSSIGFESEDYMLHGQRALWLGYPCSNGKLPFSHCQGNIAESTKLGGNCPSRFSSFFLFFFLHSATNLCHQMARVPPILMMGISTMTVEQSIDIIQSMIEFFHVWLLFSTTDRIKIYYIISLRE